MAHSVLQEVIDSGLLTDRDWFIAGGYATDPQLATDIDVWIRVDEDSDIFAEHGALLRHIDLMGMKYEPLDVLSLPQFQDSGRRDGYGATEFIEILKVAIIKAWRGVEFSKPVHLLLTTGTPEEVLQGFDISTHQIALLPNGKLVYGDDWTSRLEDPVILKDTPTTAERFVKIKNRYKGYREGRQSVFAALVGV